MKDNRILKVTDEISWIGVLDNDIVTFDIVMETKYGTTYNSYFINAEKKAIIDTVKETFWPVYLEKLNTICNPSEIEYIICNHTEPDHSGSLKHLIELAPNAIVVGSGQALNYLSEIIAKPFKSQKVKEGDIIDLGNKKIKVISAPNLHWPDTIYTYLVEDKVLFTCDSFGAHFCHPEMYNDLTGPYDDAFKYYFDVILKPFSKFMLKGIEKIKDLDIDVICPGHGPILRDNWSQYVELSAKYSEEYLKTIQSKRNTVLIVYVSAYGYTAEMAKHIADGLRSAGEMEIELHDIEHTLLGDLEEMVTRCNALIVGSPTINQNTLLQIYKLFAVISPLRDKGKLAAAFGSYGWSGEAVTIIESQLRNLKLNIACEGLAEKFYPYESKSEKFLTFGKHFGEQLLQSALI
jgi:NADH oxidase (H2O-forming)